VKRALAEKLLINVTADNVVRLLPPLVINQSESEQLVAILAKLIKQFLSE
ncbi:MAG: aspartate aminotransferase family protein, partial [Methylophilaceae bacterium]|nr:aspartate aminotransferase family protein [Methylophilaceae bacterium]